MNTVPHLPVERSITMVHPAAIRLDRAQEAQQAQFNLRRCQAMIERAQRSLDCGLPTFMYQGVPRDAQIALGTAESMKRYWGAQLLTLLQGGTPEDGR